MKKENYWKFLYILSVLLIVGFVIRLGADLIKYNPVATSAPFYIYIIERAVEFVLPAMLVFIAGIICRKKFSK